MAEKTKMNRWRVVLTIATLVGLVLLIIFSREQILDTIKNLHRINLWILALLIPIEVLNYLAQAKMYQESLRTMGHKLKTGFLFRFSLELNFVTTILPSGGLSGVSYTTLRLRSEHVSAAQSTLSQLIKTVIVFFSFLVLLVIGLIALAIGGHANDFMILIAGSLVTLLVVLTLAALFVIESKERINNVFTYLTRVINRLIKIFRPKVSETISVEKARLVFTELHDSYLLFREDPKSLKGPFLWGLLANLTEVAALYVVYVAFGHWINPGGIIIAYAVANFAGIISVLPGGAGVYEALMTVVLAGAGIPPSLSIPVTIMYRVVNTLIQIVPGYIFYQRNLQKHHEPANG